MYSIVVKAGAHDTAIPRIQLAPCNLMDQECVRSHYCSDPYIQKEKDGSISHLEPHIQNISAFSSFHFSTILYSTEAPRFVCDVYCSYEEETRRLVTFAKLRYVNP